MKNTLKNIIETFQNASILEIRNQEFFNGILFENIFSAAIFAQVNLSNCEISKTEFTEHIFKNCQLQRHCQGQQQQFGLWLLLQVLFLLVHHAG